MYGGIVLNSATGGANPDAIEIAWRLGGRIVWMPTVSARTHKAGAASAELSVHRGFELGPVNVVDDGVLRPEWHGVLDVIAAHDLVLASGHLSAAETVVLFRQARRHGVNRLMVNHPLRRYRGPARCSQSTVRPEFATAKFAIRTSSPMSRASYIGHSGKVP